MTLELLLPLGLELLSSRSLLPPAAEINPCRTLGFSTFYFLRKNEEEGWPRLEGAVSSFASLLFEECSQW